MLMSMLRALSAALLADIRAQRADGAGLRAAARHVAYRRSAYVGTVQIEPYAIGGGERKESACGKTHDAR